MTIYIALKVSESHLPKCMKSKFCRKHELRSKEIICEGALTVVYYGLSRLITVGRYVLVCNRERISLPNFLFSLSRSNSHHTSINIKKLKDSDINFILLF